MIVSGIMSGVFKENIMDFDELYAAEFREVLQRYEFDACPTISMVEQIVKLELQVECLSEMLLNRHVDEGAIEEALKECL